MPAAFNKVTLHVSIRCLECPDLRTSCDRKTKMAVEHTWWFQRSFKNRRAS